MKIETELFCRAVHNHVMETLAIECLIWYVNIDRGEVEFMLIAIIVYVLEKCTGRDTIYTFIICLWYWHAKMCTLDLTFYINGKVD